ncbi:glycosyltransferase family 4 protein [Leptolyngbya sp. PCC 6406]|uniref:glycosyltransferase family 4 protein n=1 Tax=Leptolyngbya sp. PCC 6406 TaxID=1173264 RepID=UPI0002AC4A33|nr:glycosyltransferase family 4 protein [Leptolyngbya sp. PCC 6406]
MTKARIAYISFDVVPAPKGAAIHIQTFAEALGQHFGGVQLVTVSPQETTISQGLSPEIYQTALPAVGKTLIDRVLSFRQALWGWLQGQVLEAGPLDVIHIRSPFEGFPIALHRAKLCRHLIFEVNGLPSIELKYRYPQVADDDELMHKLVAQEDACLQAADRILTPSDVTRDYLIQRGVGRDRIQVIPNGVDLSVFTYGAPRPDPVLSPLNLLYFGTLSPWQGVDLAIDALALYRRDGDAHLTIIGPGRPHQLKRLHTLAAKLQVTAHVQILDALPLKDLVTHLHRADAIVAPLKGCDRNLVQGCCPLKVLEGMATGTPVITTDLPVVRAIGNPDQHFLAVKPNSSKGIKDGLFQLWANPALRLTLSQQARQHVEQQFSWSLAHQRLIAVYESLLASP